VDLRATECRQKVWNRTRHLPSCGTVSEPTVPPLAQVFFKNVRIFDVSVRMLFSDMLKDGYTYKRPALRGLPCWV
jgi:hypothetical protein